MISVRVVENRECCRNAVECCDEIAVNRACMHQLRLYLGACLGYMKNSDRHSKGLTVE